jgi:uncharacterized RDD family membrane protein YckC
MVGKQHSATSNLNATPSEPRRLTATVLDALITILGGIAAGAAVGVHVVNDAVQVHLASPRMWGLALAVGALVSFSNHVLLTRLAGASLGKFLAGLRVVQTPGDGRPGFIRLCGRWFFGFYWIVVFVPIHLATDSNVEQQDAVGVRVVRRAVRAP